MENKLELKPRVLTEQDVGKEIVFDDLEILNCYKILHKNLIKLLFLIEDEILHNKGDAHNWFLSFMLDLKSSNSLCKYRLTKVLIKMNSLFEKDAYKTMGHAQIKRQIMESRGIVEFLIAELEGNNARGSDKK